MIEQIRRDLQELKVPSRLLDCQIHEVLTGQIDVQKDSKHRCRAVAREHGEMLVDLGSERLFIRVPEYTRNVEALIPRFPPKVSFSFSYLPKGHPIARTDRVIPFVAMLRDDRMDVMASAASDWSFAHAGCKLLVEWSAKR